MKRSNFAVPNAGSSWTVLHWIIGYWYLTQLCAKCSAKRLVPDYISEKKMREYKLSKGETEGNGDCYMTIKELDQRLTLVLEDFSSEMRSEYDDYSNEPVTGGDIAQLSRQTFYALDEFRKEIIKYLESNR